MKHCSLIALALAFVLAGALLPASASAHVPDYITQWGTFGTGDGQFDRVNGIAVDANGDVYVADASTNWGRGRIQKFKSDSTYLLQWGTLGSGNGEFQSPLLVAVDGTGRVYVGDADLFRIQIFTGAGTYLDQWGSYGSGNGEFDFPTGVAVDAGGNFYVGDWGNSRVQKFFPVPTDVPGDATPVAFALDPVRPNPSRGTLTVHFSLPTDAPARLELLDVAGRRAASDDVGMGQHTLDLGADQHLARGLYLVRLTQGANTRTTRVAVLK